MTVVHTYMVKTDEQRATWDAMEKSGDLVRVDKHYGGSEYCASLLNGNRRGSERVMPDGRVIRWIATYKTAADARAEHVRWCNSAHEIGA